MTHEQQAFPWRTARRYGCESSHRKVCALMDQIPANRPGLFRRGLARPSAWLPAVPSGHSGGPCRRETFRVPRESSSPSVPSCDIASACLARAGRGIRPKRIRLRTTRPTACQKPINFHPNRAGISQFHRCMVTKPNTATASNRQQNELQSSQKPMPSHFFSPHSFKNSSWMARSRCRRCKTA